MAKAARKVLFGRVTPAAHAWALEKVRTSNEKGLSVSVVLERLLLNDKNKVEANRRARKGKKTPVAYAA